MKRQATQWEKVLPTCVPDRGLTESEKRMPADEELLKKDNAIEKWATDLSQALRKTGYPGGQHNIKRHSILQNKGNAILKMQ